MSAVSAGTDPSDRARLKSAYVAIQKLQAQLQAAERARHEPVAIVGMACRFPGGDNPEAFWDFIARGGDAVREVPPDRWDLDAWSDADPDAPGKSYSRVGAFLDNIDGFDAPLFGIAPREAASLDPQQGLLLETTWEALEDAGLAPGRRQGSATGVFIGLCNSDYARVLLERGDAAIDAYAGTGTSPSVAAGRISYVFGLHGPSIAIDTACSSALVAVHQACQSLRGGECRQAVAGGVNLLFDPRTHVVHAKARMLSPSGRCRAFDAGADGFVRGEGCGIVVLKRLADALEDGDRVLAVIRGSAVNQDGHSSGLTAPNGPSQQAVIRQALAQAGVDPAAVEYVEAHGTGTALGDPIEAEALHAVYGQGRPRENPLWIGSVKTNVGHLEAAAGIAGLIKTILALRHERLPPHLHLENPSPHIPWERMALAVPRDGIAWPRSGRPRLAGISSFGFGGTNAHLVVEEPPHAEAAPARQATDRSSHLLCLSAAQPAALRALAGRYAAWIADHPKLEPADLAYAANTGRSQLDHRAAVLFRSREELLGRLRQLAAGEAPGMPQGRAAHRPRIGFLFTGQGSQYAGMARRLYQTQPVFRAALDQAAAVLDEQLHRPLLDVLFQPGEALNQTGYTQPALFAVQMALVALWRSWGIEPEVVLGHSVGEFAAACVAGVFGLEDGLRLIAERGRLMQGLPAGGAMAAILAEAARVTPHLDAGAGVSLAADNGAQTVISGPAAAVDRALTRLQAAGMKGQRLTVSHAFHSVLMEPILDQLAAVAARIDARPPDKVLIANVTGQPVGTGQTLDAGYWRRHAREPVRFAACVQSLAGLECDALVEIGPSPVLVSLAQRCWPAESAVPAALASLRPGRADDDVLAEALATLYVRGATLDWAAWDRPWSRKRVPLPTYPFQRVPYVVGASPRPQPRQALAGLLYAVAWQELPPLGDVPAPAGRWLIVGADLALAATLAAQRPDSRIVSPPADGSPTAWDALLRLHLRLDADGEPATTRGARKPGKVKDPHTTEPDIVSNPPAVASCNTSAAASCDVAAGRPADPAKSWSGVLYLAPRNAVATSIPTVTEHLTGEVLGLIQALNRLQAPPLLWLATAGAQPVRPDDNVAPDQAALWGLGRAALSELPGLLGGLIDLPWLEPATPIPQELAAALWAQLDAPSGEDQIALRASPDSIAHYVPRLRPRQAGPPATRIAGLQPDGRYLIAGGLGALGLHIAAWLADQGVRSLVLLGRRAVPTGPAADQVARLRSRGVEVRLIAADLGDRAGLEAALAAHWPLAGVIHAAGVSQPSAIGDTTREALQATLAAKVAGAWNLHALTAERPVGLFVCLSSVAAVWGGRGQAPYAAANAFLDALVQHRRRLGLAGLSIDYGPWLGAGMVTGEARDWLERSGLRSIRPHAALSALAALLGEGAAQAVMMDADWPRFLAVYQARRASPLLSDIAATLPAAVAPPLVPSDAPEQVPPEGRRTWIEGLIDRTLAEVLRIAAEALDPIAGFFDLGMDSLTAVEFAQLLSRRLGRLLPNTLAMDQPNRATLTDYLLRTVSGGTARSAPPASAAAADAAIAVVGLACRFPGANDPDAYWRLLADGVEAIREVPPERWDIAAYYDPDPAAPGRMYTRRGGFLDQIDQFDAALFRITPREAASLDPQQRLLLETAWEALQNAGQLPEALRGSSSGVYVGAGANEYGQMTAQAGAGAVDAYFGTGNALNVIAGRCAYALGLQGPAVTLDTACSSSLVAVHQAVLGLRAGDCDLALAGGVNLMVSPLGTVAACRARMLAPDGRCKTFDAAADGYVRGEGCGVVVLKRLSDATRDGDRILAVVKGSAVNHDGASSGLTVPNGPAQEALLRQALSRAGVSPADVAYVEAHGTGTALGDPIEVQALGAVFGTDRQKAAPLWIGSAKSHIGHLEAAAGIAGLIKVVLAMHHRQLPGQLHFHTPNPHIPWQTLPLRVVEQTTPWPADRRIAGVSSFGFSGTNAHVVLEAPPGDGEPGPIAPASPYPFRRQRYWIDPPDRPPPAASLQLLGPRQVSALSGEAVFQSRWDRTTHPFIAEHLVYGENLVPGATYAAMALSSAGLPARVSDLAFHEPMVFEGGATRLVQFVAAAPDQDGSSEFRLFSATEGEAGPWVQHATGRLRALSVPAPGPGNAVSLATLLATLDSAPAELVFERLAAVGVGLGPRFRAIQAIWRGPDQALGRLAAPPALSETAGNLVVHPALLDACTQVVGAAREPIEPALFVPWRYQQLELYAPLPATFYCHARLRPEAAGDRESATADLRFLDETGRLLGRLDGFVLKRAPRDLLLRGRRATLDALFYEARWPEAPLPEPAFADDPVLPAAIARIDPDTVLPAPPVWSRYQAIVQGLEPLALAWIVRGLQTLGWEPCSGEHVQAGTLARQLGIAARHRRLAQRLLQILGDAGMLGQAPDGWVVQRPLVAADPLAMQRDVAQRHGSDLPGALHELELLGRCGEQLPAVLRGEVDPIGILFPEDNASGAETIYRDGLGAQALGRLVRQVVAQAVGRLPVGQTLRVLEVGAGTGGTTAHILDALPPGSSYRYTDISPAFFPAARARFAAWPSVAYQALDIERNPREQGLLPQAFDLVVAANVLHATRDLDETLSHMASLMAPGGLCLLLEGVQRRAWLDLTFGLLPGWWRFNDTRRSDYPLLGAEAWSGVLAAHGLTNMAVASVAGEQAEQVVMVARRAVVEAADSDSGRNLVVAGERPPPMCGRRGLAAADGHGIGGPPQPVAGGGPAPATMGEPGGPAPATMGEPGGPEYATTGEPVATSHPSPAKPGEPEGWLIFADAGGFAEALVGRLSDASCVTVTPGPDLAQIAPDRFTLPPGNRDACARLLAWIAAGGPVLRHVVYLWGLDAAPHPDAGLPDLVQSACANLLAVGQALAGNVAASFGGLSIVTRGARPIGAEPTLAQAALLGLALGIATEHPELRCRRIDLDPSDVADAAEPLWADLHATDGEDQVAWRGGSRHVARLARMNPLPPPDATMTFRPDRSYLITGGLGGLGLEVARWMVERGARHLVLLGRGEPDASAAAALQMLRDQGCLPRVVQADVADEAAMRRLLDDIRRSDRPLHGIMHAAGQLYDAALLNQSANSLAGVFAAKVAGAWNLHRLTEGDELQVFVLFSSIVGLLGSPGQANHAAANSFLDALAHHRRCRGLPAVSIAWGPWSDIGAAARHGVEARMAGHGLLTLTPEQGIAALERCLIEAPPQAAVARIDWARLAGDLQQREPPPLLTELLDQVRDRDPFEPRDNGELLRQLTALEPADATQALVRHIQREVAQVLRLGAEAWPDPHCGWFDLGVDSLVIVELHHALQRQLGDACRLPMTFAFELPTINALAEHVVGELRNGDRLAGSVTVDPPSAEADADDDLSSLSLDQLAAELDAQMAAATATTRGLA